MHIDGKVQISIEDFESLKTAMEIRVATDEELNRVQIGMDGGV